MQCDILLAMPDTLEHSSIYHLRSVIRSFRRLGMKVYKITCYANDLFLVVASSFGEAEEKFKKRYSYKDVEVIEEIKIPLI